MHIAPLFYSILTFTKFGSYHFVPKVSFRPLWYCCQFTEEMSIKFEAERWVFIPLYIYYLSIYLPFYLFVYLTLFLSIYQGSLSHYISIYLSINLYAIYLLIRLNKFYNIFIEISLLDAYFLLNFVQG